jgi:hypothetical protein
VWCNIRKAKEGEGSKDAYFRLSFRVILNFQSASLSYSLRERPVQSQPSGALMASDESVFAVPLEASAVKEQLEPIPTWNALRRVVAGSAATTTRQQI